MSLPRVTVLFANGNLLANVSAVDGIAGLICSGVATGGMPLKTPKQIFSLADLAALGVTGQAAGTVAATAGAFTIVMLGNNGDVFTVTAGATILGTYTKTAGETTASAVAGAIRTAVNSGTPTHGYSASGTGASITLTAPVALGSAANNVVAKIAWPGGDITLSFSGGVSGITNEHLYRQVREYYDAVGGRQELWIMTVADTVTMAQALNKDTSDHAPLLLSRAGGRIRLLAVCRKPPAGYNGGADYLDADVPAALTQARLLVTAQQDGLNFFRVLIEGRVQNPASTTYFEPQATANGCAGVVLGGSLADGSASVGTILGRACRYGAHIKLGKVANGPLPLTSAYVGNKALADMSNLSYLHGLGYISFMEHPGKSGYYAGIDRMASTDDYRLLAYGRLVDKAATIAAAVYIDSLESEVELEEGGKIASQEVAYLRAIVSQQIQALMGDQISSHQVLIDEDQNIVNTGKLQVQLRIQPLGYASFIEVTVGLTASV